MEKRVLKLILLLLVSTAYSQNQKATLFFNNGSVKKGLASIERVTDRTIKFRMEKGKKITYYDYEQLKSIIIEQKNTGIAYDAEYEYRKYENEKRPKLVQVYDGYVVGTSFIKFKNGSELKGTISHKNPSKPIIIFIDCKGNKSKISLDEIDKISIVLETRIADYYYILREKKPYMMELLVKGKLSLFEINGLYSYYANGTPNPGSTFYVLKDNESIAFKLINSTGYYQYGEKNFKKNAIEYFSDCPILQKKLILKEYKMKDTKKVVEFYNNNCEK